MLLLLTSWFRVFLLEPSQYIFLYIFQVETHLNDIEVNQWTTDDVEEWLDLIGLSHLKNVFFS